MESKSTDILVLLIFTALWFYQLYKIWFQIDDEYKKALERSNWIPKWLYPFKNVTDDFLSDKKQWIIMSRVGSILMTIIVIWANIQILFIH